MVNKDKKPYLYDLSIWGDEDVSSGKGAQDENFPVGSLLISRQLRPHVQAYYDFARVIDDIADSETLSAESKVARLNAMEAVLFHDVPAPDRHDILTARYLRNTLLETEVSFDTATDLLVAFRQDAVKKRYETFDELLEYCRYSANPVGHFLLQLHGENIEAVCHSDALCTSLQILNHLQDCKNDLIRLDRCYIPADILEQEGASVADLKASHMNASVRRVFDVLLDHVEALNREADLLPCLTANRRLRLESAVIVNLAHCLTANLREGDALATRVKLTKRDAITAMLKAFRYFW